MTGTIATTIANQIAYYLKKEIQINADFLDNAFSRTKYNYPWLSETDMKTPQNTHHFTRQAILKEKISCIPNSNQETTERKWKWVVNEWGGIKQFDVSKRVKECYNEETYKGDVDSYLKYQLCTLSSVSSFSKIASFTKPNEWFVYDSRVTYVLDWLLFKCGDKQDYLYFRIPDSYSGRRKIMSNHIGNDARYFARRECYAKYCELVKAVAKVFQWEKFSLGDKHPCKIEMILFALGKNGGIVDSEIRKKDSQNQQSTPKPKSKRKSDRKTPSIRNNTRENRELQRQQRPRIQWKSNGKEIVISKDTAQLIQDKLEKNYTIRIILPGQRVIQYTNINSLKYSALRQKDLGNSLVKLGINRGDCRDIIISTTENSDSREMKINISFNS